MLKVAAVSLVLKAVQEFLVPEVVQKAELKNQFKNPCRLPDRRYK